MYKRVSNQVDDEICGFTSEKVKTSNNVPHVNLAGWFTVCSCLKSARLRASAGIVPYTKSDSNHETPTHPTMTGSSSSRSLHGPNPQTTHRTAAVTECATDRGTQPPSSTMGSTFDLTTTSRRPWVRQAKRAQGTTKAAASEAAMASAAKARHVNPLEMT